MSESNTTRRFIAAGLFLLIGAAALAYAFLRLFTPDSGWRAIQAGAAGGPTCGEEFVFLYELGAGEQSASAENKAVNMIYTDACRKAFQLFHTVEGFEGLVNLYEINQHPNEALEVDQTLYSAFAAVQAAGDRTVYLGPVYARYGDLFYCADDAQLVDFDPRLSEEVREEYAAIAAYAADPRSIDIELLGEGKIRLNVSEEYLAYARREGIDRFLDFGWMKNAFVVDYLADSLIAAGFTHGSITSFDGFARCLDGREGTYSLNLYGRQEGQAIHAGVMKYQGPMSIVNLRAFSVDVSDSRLYYRLKNGETRTLYLSPVDGMCRSAADSMVCYSRTHGCAQLAMEAAPLFIADMLDTGLAKKLEARDVWLAWCREQTLWTTDPELAVADLYQDYTLSVVAP